MEIPHYLALSAAEFAFANPLPEHIAWMSCRFSPYGRGLINLPDTLPPGSVCILDDSTPINNHDLRRIADELENTLSRCTCLGLLLDFQRANRPEQAELVSVLTEVLSFPIAAPPQYAMAENILFLPPVPAEDTPEKYLTPWKGRRIWLDTGMSSAVLTLNESGCRVDYPGEISPQSWRQDAETASAYHIRKIPGAIECTLCRIRESLPSLLEKCSAHGVELAIGLWQEYREVGK